MGGEGGGGRCWRILVFILLLHCQSVLPSSSFFLSFLSSTTASVPSPRFSGRRHKIFHKCWCVVKQKLTENPAHTHSYTAYGVSMIHFMMSNYSVSGQPLLWSDCAVWSETSLPSYAYPVSILYKSIAGRYRPVRVADGPITTRCRFI